MSPANPEEYDRALGIALKLLKARNRFSGEIRAELSAKQVDENSVAQVIDYLVHKGLIRDAELAEDLAETAVKSKVWGPLRIRRELEQRLAPVECIERALSLIPSESDLLQRALAKLGERSTPSLARRLYADGFSRDAIESVLETR
ncbi:MAG: RecX family transcriptional regulator [Fimbriimonadales bacterium]